MSWSIARIRRRILFRSTAFPTLRGIAYPILALCVGSWSDAERNSNRSEPRPRRMPSALKRSKERRPDRASITRRVAFASCCGDGLAQHARPECSYEREIHASSSACAHWADKSASLFLHKSHPLLVRSWQTSDPSRTDIVFDHRKGCKATATITRNGQCERSETVRMAGY